MDTTHWQQHQLCETSVANREARLTPGLFGKGIRDKVELRFAGIAA
jgi:hypothetical protein